MTNFPLSGDEPEIVFGPCRALPTSRRLLVDGEPVTLGGRTFDLLLALIDTPGAIVPKERIYDRVWPDVVVGEANLRVQISMLRKALGVGRDLLRTIPGRGYLIAEVERAALDEPVPSTSPGANNLRLPAKPLIGRAAELAQLDELLERGRLVTLVGAGGIGKTRLALEAGLAAGGRFADGVWPIDLGPIPDAATVTSAIAAALAIPLRGPDGGVEMIAAALGAQRRLLIFDNCEHLIDGLAPLIETLLNRCPGIVVLATSQESLRIAAEQLLRLRPLALPPSDAVAVDGFAAIELFVARVQAADRQFQLTAGNAAAIAEICRRLDGVPLALEMAAAQVPTLGLPALRVALAERLTALGKDEGQDDRAHHGTLRSLADWSHGLLDDEEQRIFRRLAVFSGSFSLESAVTIVKDETVAWWDAVDSLSKLIEKSLLTVEGGEPPRYRLLETLRAYAAEQLEASGEREWVAERHAAFFETLFERADAEWETAIDADWLVTYRPEVDQIRSALGWLLADAARSARAVALAGAAVHMLDRLLLYSEGRDYTDRAVTLIGPDTPRSPAARLLKRAAALWFNTDRPRAFELASRSEAFYREAGDRPGLATGLIAVGSLHMFMGRPEDAKAALDEARGILVGSGQQKSLFNLLCTLGMFAMFGQDGAEARSCFAAALDVARAMQDPSRASHVLMNLAEIDFSLDDLGGAAARGREAVAAFRATDRFTDLGVALINLAAYLLIQGDVVEGREVAVEALARARGQGGFIVRACLQRWALLGALEQRHEAAAQLLGHIDAGYAATGERREPTEQRVRDRLHEKLVAALTPTALEAALAVGAGWSEAEALAFTTASLS